MPERSPSPSSLVGQPSPAMRIVAAVGGTEDAGAVIADRRPAPPRVPSPASRSTCTGKVTWTIAPQREVSECVLPRGHRGDHRDGVGYPWNEGRWLD